MRFEPLLEAGARRLPRAGISANAVTLAACAVGLAGRRGDRRSSWYLAGLVLILLSRFGDGLDGAVASDSRPDRSRRLSRHRPRFPVLRRHSDRLRPCCARRQRRGRRAPAVFLLRQRRRASSPTPRSPRSAGMASEARGPKSLFFTTGLAEATETIAVFALFCLLPPGFPLLAYAFARADLLHRAVADRARGAQF